jgi:trigger factor
MPDDHANERVRDQDVTFKVTLEHVQERLLPDWDELPVLEEFEGTLDELREKTRSELAETLRNSEERETVDTYIKQLVSQTEYDIPDALITQEADELLHQQGHQFERYGITLEQMLQYRGQTHDQAVEELKPQAEEQLRTTLALREVIRAEGLSVNEAEIDAELADILDSYEEEQRDRARILLTTQLRSTVASSAFDKKLRAHLLTIATGGAPDFDTQPAAETEAGPTPATQLQETASNEQSREVPVITEAEE